MSSTSTSSRYHDGQYLDSNPAWHAEDAPFKAEQVLRMIRRHHLTPIRICDVGCGTGDVLRQLQSRLPSEAELHGYDISRDAISIANSRKAPGLTCHLGDASVLAPHDFDLALVLDVFEHVEDYLGFLRRLRPIARAHMFHVPLELSASAAIRGSSLLQARGSVGHLHYFSRDTAIATLQDCGYSVVDSFYTPAAFSSPDQVRTRLANVPRRVLGRVAPHFAARLLGGWSLLVLARTLPQVGGAG